MQRPRLSHRALARRHLVSGVEKIALHDATSGALFVLTPCDWELVRRADGARTLEELARSDAEGDEGASLASVSALFAELAAEGLVDDGPREEATPLDLEAFEALRVTLADRPIEGLLGYELVCDGGGECCDSYASLVVTARDRARAEAVGLTLFPGRTAAESMTPFSGAQRSDAFAMGLVEGRCIERGADGRCGLHARGGADAKPVACRLYPFTFVDDGDAVRSSVVCECSCVFRSLDRAGGSLDTSKESAGTTAAFVRDLPPETRIRRVEDYVALTDRAVAPRAVVSRWSRTVLETPDVDNPVALLLDQSIALDGLARGASHAEGRAPSPMEILAGELARFADRAASGSASANAWRAPGDRTREGRARVAEAARRASDPARLARLFESRDLARDEMFFVRASLWGLLLGEPLVRALAEAAARLIVAREIGRDAGRHPIALVESVRRGLG